MPMHVSVQCALPVTLDLSDCPWLFFAPFIPSPGQFGKPAEDRSAVLYSCCVKTFVAVDATSKRLAITRLLADMFKAILDRTRSTDTGIGDYETLLYAVYLSTNSLGPQYEGIETGIGGKVISQAVSQATGMSHEQIKREHDKLGDMGDVAFKARRGQRPLVQPPPLTIKGVYQTLRSLADMNGKGSTKRKSAAIQKMLVACGGEETRYLVRTLLRNLRIGAVGKTVQTAIAHAVVEHRKDIIELSEAADAVKLCYSQHPCWDSIIKALLEGGVEKMKVECGVTPGVPIKPMLADLCKNLDDLAVTLNGRRFQADYKYDGQRAQLHLLSDGTVRIFSRHLEETTSRFPDAITALRGAIRKAPSGNPVVTSCIVDAELVAVDRDTNTVLPFQQLQTRPRKDVKESEITTHVQIMLFDIMHLNETSLLEEDLETRHAAMLACFTAQRASVDFVPRQAFEPSANDGSHDVGTLQAFLHGSLHSKCEGVMVKELGPPLTLASIEMLSTIGIPREFLPGCTNAPLAYPEDTRSTYVPSQRCSNWRKVKKDYLAGLADTIDVVPIGAWWGNGRKAGWYSPFLLAVYDPETEEYQALCKIISGFSDEFYQEQLDFYSGDRLCSAKKAYYHVGDGTDCDVWFEPSQVWEIKGAEITISPRHRAASGQIRGHTGGLSLRFPRFLRIRDDKAPADATTAKELVNMFQKQSHGAIPSHVGGDNGGDNGGAATSDEDY